jgi:hypothetical protein
MTFPRRLGADEQFVNRLRVTQARASKHADEYIAGASTVFKNLGISGWQSGPVKHAEIVGTLYHPPSAGTDDCVSLDLDVERVVVGRKWLGLKENAFDIGTSGGVPHHRYIRIEYAHRSTGGQDDARYEGWKVGDKLRVAGPVRWDTDREGFFELHPTRAQDVTVVPSAPVVAR